MTKAKNLIKLIEEEIVPMMGAEELPPAFSIKYIGQIEGWELIDGDKFVGRFPTQQEAVDKAWEVYKEYMKKQGKAKEDE